MAEGGPTQKELEELRKNAIGYNKLINQLFGRTLNMTVSDVSGREQILNPDSSVNANQNLQYRSNLGYGRVMIRRYLICST